MFEKNADPKSIVPELLTIFESARSSTYREYGKPSIEMVLKPFFPGIFAM